jgi:hypothetical protein
MGIMAGEASLCHRVVLEPGFGDFLAHFLVTSETEVVSFLYEIEFAVCAMGVMAFHAVPLGNYLVDAFRIIGNHLLVAGVANSGGIGCKQLPVSGSMGIMTANAVTFF